MDFRRSIPFTPPHHPGARHAPNLSIGASAVFAEVAELRFEERVRAQEAIERVYHAHRIGDTRPFEQAMPKGRIEQKVNRYLAQSVALEAIWDTPLTASLLDRELERIARNTRLPGRLQELFTALANDPVLVRECLARPVLVDRMTRRRASLYLPTSSRVTGSISL